MAVPESPALLLIQRNKRLQYETLKQLSATSGISLFLKNNMGSSNLIWACKFLQEMQGMLSKVLLSNLFILPTESIGKQSIQTQFGKETVFTVRLKKYLRVSKNKIYWSSLDW